MTALRRFTWNNAIKRQTQVSSFIPIGGLRYLNHWGRVTHKCFDELTSIGSDNGLSPGGHQAIIRINAGILSIRTFGTNLSEILFEIYTFLFKKMHFKMSSGKWRSYCLGLNMLTLLTDYTPVYCMWKIPKAKQDLSSAFRLEFNNISISYDYLGKCYPTRRSVFERLALRACFRVTLVRSKIGRLRCELFELNLFRSANHNFAENLQRHHYLSSLLILSLFARILAKWLEIFLYAAIILLECPLHISTSDNQINFW